MDQISPSDVLTTEILLEELKECKAMAFSFVAAKIYFSDDRRREWVNRAYGGPRGLFNEVYQEVALKLLTTKDQILKYAVKKYIFFELRVQLKIYFYHRRPEIFISGSKEFDDYLERIPEEMEDENEYGLPRIIDEISKAGLNEREQKILKYQFFEDMDYDLICEKLGLKRDSAIKSRNIAISKLRSHIAQNGKIRFYAN